MASESKALNEEAFHSFIKSVVPDCNNTLTSNAIQKLTEKLGELVGNDAVENFNQSRNERGELVNEEGLPVIDISEPAPEPEQDRQERSLLSPGPLIPLNELPSVARERLRQQRERILEALEEEELQEEERERQREREEHEEITHTRLEAAATEKERLRAAKELQKKMGRALLRNMAASKEKEDKEKEFLTLKEEEELEKKKTSPTQKKTVAFVDEPDEVSSSKNEETWGDIIPARLRSNKRPTLLSGRQQPMRMEVVERVPGGKATVPKPELNARDSDDESDRSTLGHDSEDEYVEDGEHTRRNGFDDDTLEDEVDYDYAAYQRQIELEYHEKRAAIAEAAAAALQNHSHLDGDDHDQLLDVGANSSGIPRPTMSQFRASRLASAYEASNPGSSSSLGGFVVPASSARTLQRAVRSGKVDVDGNLIGGGDDSASEAEDGGMQEVLELLKKGEVYNIGPNGEYIHTIPPSSIRQPPEIRSTKLHIGQLSKPLPSLSSKSTTSRFKVSRLAAGRPSGEPLSPSQTPVNHMGRSSPKMGSPIPTPTDSEFPSSTQEQETTSPSSASLPIHSPIPSNSPRKAASPISTPAFPKDFNSPSSHLTSKQQPILISFPPRASSRPDRPPIVVASGVRDATSSEIIMGQGESAGIPQQFGKKVSRFKKDRL